MAWELHRQYRRSCRSLPSDPPAPFVLRTEQNAVAAPSQDAATLHQRHCCHDFARLCFVRGIQLQPHSSVWLPSGLIATKKARNLGKTRRTALREWCRLRCSNSRPIFAKRKMMLFQYAFRITIRSRAQCRNSRRQQDHCATTVTGKILKKTESYPLGQDTKPASQWLDREYREPCLISHSNSEVRSIAERGGAWELKQLPAIIEAGFDKSRDCIAHAKADTG
jgi:hypothetical protein